MNPRRDGETWGDAYTRQAEELKKLALQAKIDAQREEQKKRKAEWEKKQKEKNDSAT